ncbi:MAG: hypothetical protein AAGD11_15670 [Planctomycetota bacterium]
MTEVWLRPNRRVLLLAMVPITLLHGAGIYAFRVRGDLIPVWLSGLVVIATGALLLGLIWQSLKPRIAYRNGQVLFFLRTGAPFAVPIKVVEAFFQGEGLAHLPAGPQDGAKSVNLIARLSQRHAEWQQRDVKPALGRWDEGYITVHGTWCEPIDGEVIRRLNRRLAEVTRQDSAQAESSGKV